MSFKEFRKELNGNRVEGELIKDVLFSLVLSFVAIALVYFFWLRNIPNFISKYGFYLFFAAIGYSLIVPTIRQVRAYKQFSCMSGMMIGMTVGMIAGFLAGFFIGATNGMFFGGMFGMIVGIALGIWLGSCCGIMGSMEGIMAGFMGGWMGAMTSVMLINDHLRLATIFIFIVCSAILFSLNYMIYVETKDRDDPKKEESFMTILIAGVLTLLTLVIMVLAPRGFI
jgi:hypothetical protein